MKTGFFQSAAYPDLILDDSQDLPTIQKPMPQYLDKNVADKIEGQLKTGKGAAASSGIFSIIIAKAVGGSL